jgi:hypothetical protein
LKKPAAVYQTSAEDSFVLSIDRLTRKYLVGWESVGDERPAGLEEYTPELQGNNENEVQQFVCTFPDRRQHREMMEEDERLLLRQRARMFVARLVVQGDDPALTGFMDNCESVGKAFAQKARLFDEMIGTEEVLQALRNQWVFNSIQFYFDVPVSLTAASFAYSMLYPYTDNCLDRGTSGDHRPSSFVHWLYRRLGGASMISRDPARVAVSQLLEMIDTHYPRSRFPEVHASIMAIHAAQQKSLLLHAAGRDGNDDALLAITIEKGGTSVLVDGYLVDGSLAPEHADAMFAFGVMLQLIDDLEDIDEDRRAGHSSPFTRANRDGTLESATNRLLNFITLCVDTLRESAPGGKDSLCSLMGRSCTLLVLEAIARHREYYSHGYTGGLEKYMPFGLNFFGGLRQIVAERAGTYGDIWSPVARAAV